MIWYHQKILLESVNEINVSTSTVRRRLGEAGLYDRIAVKKPLLKKQTNVKRLQGDLGAQRLDNKTVK